MNENGKNHPILRSAAAAGIATALALGIGGCKSKEGTAPIVSGTDANGQDPALANLAQPYTGGAAGGYTNANPGTTQVLGQSEGYNGQANGEDYGYDSSQAAPIVRQYPQGSAPPPYDGGQEYTDAEEAGAEAIADTDQAPPPLPVYDQPPAPEPNDLWTPGYWNYGQAGYYWVPGLWVAPPFYGALWTPPWWGWGGGGHWLFHRGYWGPHVGFYGGVNYGFGYIGTGYFGGFWRGHDFVYNRAVTNINPGVVHNFYDRPVVYNGQHYGPMPNNRVSYNGGRGGIDARPNPAQLGALHEAHYAPMPAQREVRMQAASNRGQFFAANGGRPAAAFQPRPVGSVRDIASAPHEQPFNRGAAIAPGRPGAPAAAPRGFAGAGMPAGRPGPQTGPMGGRPDFAGRPGGEPNRVGGSPGAPPNGGFARPGVEPNRPGGQPAFNGARPEPQPNGGAPRVGEPNRPGNQPGFGARPGYQPNQGSQHPGGQPNQPFGGRPGGQPNQGFERPGAQPNQGFGRPGGEPNRAPGPVARPQAAPQMHAAPAMRPAPSPQSRPGPAPQMHPAPPPRAAAPEPHGGGEGGHHH